MLIAAFYLAAGLALTAGIMVVLERNPVVSALDLAVCLVSIGVIYLLLDAYMLAAIQIFVYAGAVVVLILFVIMLLALGAEERQPVRLRFQLYAAPLLGTTLLLLVGARLSAAGGFGAAAPLAPEVAAERTKEVGRALLLAYLYPFEVVSILLLVSMVAASSVIVCLFLGGWHLPFVTKEALVGPGGALLQVAVFLSKVLAFLFFFIWVRWTLPRFRYDQLMKLGWKVLLPLSLVNLLFAGAGVAVGLF